MKTENHPAGSAPAAASAAHCRGCGEPLRHVFVDLGLSPIANDYLKPEQLAARERVYPLRAYVCEKCLLVQIEEFEAPDTIFNEEYAYFSSYSDSWVQHARRYVEMMMERFHFGPQSQVIEIASNDGYLLQWFHQKGVPVLGIEPSANTAAVAEKKGIRSITKFFGVKLARELVAQGTTADLVLGNNVLAHVPDTHDFVAGIKIVLKPAGIVTFEFPHFLNLFEQNQFDTIYHEHFCYFSLLAVQRIFAAEGLTIFDVDEIPTHGGSLRIYARHSKATAPAIAPNVERVIQKERRAGLDHVETYRAYGERAAQVKKKFVELLRGLKKTGAKIAAYGAPAKGNTLLNYCGVGTDLIAFTVDRAPSKQDHFLPGSHIPIYHPDRIKAERPDYIVILPWNLKDEITQQLAYVREWGGKFIVPIPEPQILA